MQQLPEPPQNGEFMIAAYTLVAVVLTIYTISLFLRAGKVSREAEGWTDASS